MWKEIKVWYVKYDYEYEAYHDFYTGNHPRGGGQGISRLFLTKAEAENQTRKWKRPDEEGFVGPSTGHVHSSTDYKILNKTLWVQGRGKNRRFALKKPLECKKACSHCPSKKFVGLRLVEIMCKLGVDISQMTRAEQRYVEARSLDLYPELAGKSLKEIRKKLDG